jgi:regulator of protease activity HflC (stomatin/prohibitin superfamily)
VEISPFLILIAAPVLYFLMAVKVLNEYERGVVFRLGKLLPQAKGPGVIFVFPPIDRMVRVSLRTTSWTCRRRTSSRGTTSR